MKSIRSLAMLAALAVGLSCLTACATDAVPGDPTASTPAMGHFKADLAASYDALKVIDVGTTAALQSGAITKTQAQGVQKQRQAFKQALDSLAQAGVSASSQTTLTATLAAINAAVIFVTISQGVPKS
jgi:hypothetical protein